MRSLGQYWEHRRGLVDLQQMIQLLICFNGLLKIIIRSTLPGLVGIGSEGFGLGHGDGCRWHDYLLAAPSRRADEFAVTKVFLGRCYFVRGQYFGREDLVALLMCGAGGSSCCGR